MKHPSTTASYETRIRNCGVLAVLRASSTAAALAAADALVRGGVVGIEVAFTTPGAADVIRKLTAEYGEQVCVGAGTVLTEKQAKAAAEAGAEFLVSPGTQSSVIRAMNETGCLVIGGALTPTEILSALDMGVDIVKIFPASLGGPAYIGALSSPFPHVPLMPTGGVTPENLGEWFAHGAMAVGVGSDLVNSTAVSRGDWGEIERRAARFTLSLAETHHTSEQVP